MGLRGYKGLLRSRASRSRAFKVKGLALRNALARTPLPRSQGKATVGSAGQGHSFSGQGHFDYGRFRSSSSSRDSAYARSWLGFAAEREEGASRRNARRFLKFSALLRFLVRFAIAPLSQNQRFWEPCFSLPPLCTPHIPRHKGGCRPIL